MNNDLYELADEIQRLYGLLDQSVSKSMLARIEAQTRDLIKEKTLRLTDILIDDRDKYKTDIPYL